MQEKADSGLPAGGKSPKGHFSQPQATQGFQGHPGKDPRTLSLNLESTQLLHLATFLGLQEVSAWKEDLSLRIAEALNQGLRR